MMDQMKLIAKFTQKIQNLSKIESNSMTSSKKDEQIKMNEIKMQKMDPEKGKNQHLMADQEERQSKNGNNNDEIGQFGEQQRYQQNNNYKNQVDLISSQKSQQQQVNYADFGQEQEQFNNQILSQRQNRQKQAINEMNQNYQQRICDEIQQEPIYQILPSQQNNQFAPQSDGNLLQMIKMKMKNQAKNYRENQNGYNLLAQRTNNQDQNQSRQYQNSTNNPNDERNQPNLTEGRQYDEGFRRKFVKRLMKSISIQSPQKINDIIKSSAHKIQVHLYQVKIWLTSYKLIFNIQKYISQKGQVNQQQKMGLIKKQLLTFLKKNRNQKRYRVVKILNYLFQTFNFMEIKTHAWVNQFVNQFSGQLRGMEISKANRGKSGDEDSDDQRKQKQSNSSNLIKKIKNDKKPSQSSMKDSQNQYNQISSMKKKGKINKKQNNQTLQNNKSKQASIQNPISEPIAQDISMYPGPFKIKMAEKINYQIINAIDQIFRSKSDQFCLNYNSIKCIYKQNGSLIIKQKNSQQKTYQSSASINTKQKAKNDKQNVINKQPDQALQTQSKGMAQKNMAQNAQKGNNTSNMNQSRVMNQKSAPNKNQQIPRPTSSNMRIVQNTTLIPEGPQQMNLLGRLEARLLNFLKSNPNCFINTLQKQTEAQMQAAKFSDKLKNEVRTQWFCHFLRKNKYSISSDKKVIRIVTNTQRQQTIGNGRTPQNAGIANRPPPSMVNMNPNLINPRQSRPQMGRSQQFEGQGRGFYG